MSQLVWKELFSESNIKSKSLKNEQRKVFEKGLNSRCGK